MRLFGPGVTDVANAKMIRGRSVSEVMVRD
jgi:hypothetical protein